MQLAADVASVLIEFREQIDSQELDEEESHEHWMDTKEEIAELFLDEEWELSNRTVRKEIQEALHPMSRPQDDQDLKEYFEDIIKDMRMETRFTAYLYFPELVDMPVGKEVGGLKIIEKPEHKEELVDRMEGLFEGSEHYTTLYRGRAWGKFTFSTYKRQAYIREELFDEIQRALGALKVSIGKTSTPEELAGAIYNGEGFAWYLDPENEPSGWTRYDERIAEPTLSDLSEILNKSEKDRTLLEENLAGTIQLLTLHSDNYRNEHSFLTLIGALEGLLLTKNETPKSSKMAEKTVQLLYSDQNDPESQPQDVDIKDKINDHNRIKGWYQTRSEIIHGGYQNVTREEVTSLERTVGRVAKELVSLTDEYYSIQKQGGENNPHTGMNEMFLRKRLRATPADYMDNDSNE